tara:strand:- start:218 stop:544 length:327 start_codon:yes stop_codon:yes gene_type:complete
MAYNNNIIENIEVIKDLLHTDLQRRLFADYNKRTDEFQLRDEDYDRACSILLSDISVIKTMKGVNDILCHYSDLFTSYDEQIIPTIDGTQNYVIDLLVKQCELTKQPV